MQQTITNVERALRLKNGMLMPTLGLGTWGMQGEEELAVLFALEEGYRHIDTAKIYGTEAGIGSAIEKSAVPREDIFITTKLWNSDQGYESGMAAIDESLAKLNTAYVDLYLVHWPSEDENRRRQTWRAMEAIHESGKALAIGVSNYEVAHLMEMEKYARTMPTVNQIERHPFRQQRDIVEYCERNNIVVTNYSPLTRGKRTSEPVVEEIANKYNKSDAQILIRWGLQHGNVVIPKSAQRVHIRENFEVFDFELNEADMDSLDALDEEYSVV